MAKTTKKRTKSKKAAVKKAAPKKKAAKKKLAAKKKPLPKKKPAPKKPATKKKAAKRALAQKAEVTLDVSPGARSRRVTDREIQGLSDVAAADSESVDELLDEGNAFEAGIGQGRAETPTMPTSGKFTRMRCRKTMCRKNIWIGSSAPLEVVVSRAAAVLFFFHEDDADAVLRLFASGVAMNHGCPQRKPGSTDSVAG